MSLRLEMLQVARLAPKTLGDSSDLVREFLLRQINSDGGFKDRSGTSDLYYTVFGLDGLISLREEMPKGTREFVAGFGQGAGLDFVHLCCLARAWAALDLPPENNDKVVGAIERFRTTDGGYHVLPEQPFGTVYAGFLAMGAYQDVRMAVPDPLRLVRSLKFLETRDGAWANDRNMKAGSTNATAAAVTLLKQLDQPINATVETWLFDRVHPDGGFRASPEAPLPDLLSTATALHALSTLQAPLEPIKESCLDFIDTLWTNEGSFHGHWGDDLLDAEYTFYGLLALGNLSV